MFFNTLRETGYTTMALLIEGSFATQSLSFQELRD